MATPALAQEAPPPVPSQITLESLTVLTPESLTLNAASLRNPHGDPKTDGPLAQLLTPGLKEKPRRPAALLPLYGSLVALQGMDIHSTRRALGSGGGREANPAMRNVVRNSAAFVAAKAGATAGVIWVSEKMWKKNRKGTVIFVTVVNAALAAIVANNYRHAR